MAFKILGSLFDKIITKSDVDNINERIESITKVDLTGLNELESELQNLDQRARASAEEIAALEEQVQNAVVGSEDEKNARKLLAIEVNKAKKLGEEEKEIREKLIDLAEKNNKETKIQQVLVKTLAQSTTLYKDEQKKLLALMKEGKLSSAEYGAEMEKLKQKNFANVIKELTGNVEGSVTEGLEKVMGGAIDAIASGFGPLGKMLAEVIKKFIGDAIKQVMQSNDILTDLKRQTGGLAEAQDLGYDAFGNSQEGMKSLPTAAAQGLGSNNFGNSQKGMKSLSTAATQDLGSDAFGNSQEGMKSLSTATTQGLGSDNFSNSVEGMKSLSTAAAQANISMEQFKESIASLYGGGFGNTIGMKADLNNSQKDLQNFGIEAARLSKLYSANIGPAVRSLVMNFGQSVGEATKNMREGALEARALGINVSSFVEKFDQVVDLIGNVYISSTEGMKNLALYASQLNINVNELAGGIIKTNSLNDLFINQQKTLAMGLSTTSAQLSRIYALNVRGEGDKAAKLEMASLAQDIFKMGQSDEKGNLTTQGIKTLDAMGLSQEQRKAVTKNIMEMQTLGFSLEQLSGSAKLTEKQMKALELQEMENVKASEQFANVGKQLQAVFIDPLASAIGPIIKFLGVLAEGIMNVVGWIMDILPIGAALKGIGEVFTWLSESLTVVAFYIKQMWQEVEPVVAPIINLFKWLGELIGNFIGILTALGMVIGIAFSPILLVLAKLALVVGVVVGAIYLLKKGFDLLYNKFDWFRNGIDILVNTFKKVKDKISGWFDWDDDDVKEATMARLGGAKSWEEVYQKQGQGGISSQVKSQIEVISTASKGQADFIKTFTVQQAQAKESKQPLNINVQNKTDGTFDSEAQTKRTINM